jgi:3-oxoacyl-[acyl-carrier protein] reductase
VGQDFILRAISNRAILRLQTNRRIENLPHIARLHAYCGGMANLFTNKTALVTGATRGIGRAIASMLAQEGANVMICGRSQRPVDQTVQALAADSPGKVKGKAADVRVYAEVQDLFRFIDAEFGALDILINNAGVGVFRNIADLSVEDWNFTIDTNLNGVFHCCREALSRFRTRAGGQIVNISSLAGKNPFAGGAAYNASKFALNGFSEAVMLDQRNQNVRVSYIMPGSVATEFGAQSRLRSNAGAGSTAESAEPVASDDSWKIAPEDIADIVRLTLALPERTLISRVEVRPSRPKR